jgi:uncharacterized protein YacL (UPF0231 family)
MRNPDEPDYERICRQKRNKHQQFWAEFSDRLDCLDPAFADFALKYGEQGWMFRRNINRQPARQIDTRPEARVWFCMGAEAVGHWYQVELRDDTPFEFGVVATWKSTLGQSLVRRGSLIESVVITTLASRIETLLEEGKHLLDSWSLPEDIPHPIGGIVDGWEAGPYFPQARQTSV